MTQNSKLGPSWPLPEVIPHPTILLLEKDFQGLNILGIWGFYYWLRVEGRGTKCVFVCVCVMFVCVCVTFVCRGV